MIVRLLIVQHLDFLSLKGGCTGSSKSTHVKMPHCWKSHVTAQSIFTGKTNEKMAVKGRKRSQEGSPGNIEKKKKLKADADQGSKTVLESFSPRRSSRTSIPNSRYKDLEEVIPGRKSKSGQSVYAGDKISTRRLVIMKEIWKGRVNLPTALVL